MSSNIKKGITFFQGFQNQVNEQKSHHIGHENSAFKDDRSVPFAGLCGCLVVKTKTVLTIKILANQYESGFGSDFRPKNRQNPPIFANHGRSRGYPIPTERD